MIIRSIDDIKEDYRRHSSGHWFDPKIMRSFRSRLSEETHTTSDGRLTYFVSSEQFCYPDSADPRRYTVRAYDWVTHNVSTVGELQAYKTGRAAKAAALRLANQSFGLPVGV